MLLDRSVFVHTLVSFMDDVLEEERNRATHSASVLTIFNPLPLPFLCKKRTLAAEVIVDGFTCTL